MSKDLAPYRYPPQIRSVILERLEAGEFLKRMCREADMPCHESVTGWMRADPAFAAQVAQARRVGEHRRRWMFDPAKAAVFLARVRAGERVGDVLRDPAMPSQATYRYWKATEAPFAEAMHAMRQVRREEVAARARARYRDYDPAIGERIYVRLWKGETLRAILRSDRAFPSLSVLARWRRENPEFEAMLQVAIGGWRRKNRKRRLLTPEMQDAIIDGLAQGGSLRSLSQEPGMPSQKSLYNWYRTNPEFARAVDWACEEREDTYLSVMADAAGAGAFGKRRFAQLNAQRVRLRKRPGWKARKAGGAEILATCGAGSVVAWRGKTTTRGRIWRTI